MPAPTWQRFTPTLALYGRPLIRADFGIVEGYTPTRGSEKPLPCPLVACKAIGDNRVSDEQMAGWSEYAADYSEVKFDVTPLPWSTPHRAQSHAPTLQRA